MSTPRRKTMQQQTPVLNDTNRTLLAAVVVSIFIVIALVAITQVPRVSQTNTNVAPTGNTAAATPLPPAPTLVTNRLGIIKEKDGTTLTITAQTIIGQELRAVDYVVRTGPATTFESVDFRKALTTSQTAPRAATTLEAIPVGAQVNVLASENIRDKQEFAATHVEHHLITP
jgi:hypothetical protein